MVNLNTLQIEILKAENGFSVAVNRPINEASLNPYNPEAIAEMAAAIKKEMGKSDGEEWKALMEEEPFMQVKEKPQSSLLIFASFDKMVEYLRGEFEE